MKKQNITVVSLIVIMIGVVCVLLLGGKSVNQNNNLNPQNQNIEKVNVSSLSVGNWVSVVAEKVDGIYTASMIMVCENKDSCQAIVPQGENKNPPSGDTPTGKEPRETRNPPSGDMPTPPTADQNTRTGNVKNKTMLSGTISEVNADSIILSLDTGEVATILLSDSTVINKK
ncbi:MAG: hypothetical protein WC319_08985 [Candidatus Paceibacterota bacterium]|jgi:hypothetical protein